MINAVILIQGCSHLRSQNGYANIEIVMREGMKITATNNIGTITITAGKGFERFYSWEGEIRSVIMFPRKERWNGKYGLYFPGSGNHWEAHNRITRGVLEEAQLHYNTKEDALTFLSHPSRIDSTVYSDDGLVVTWNKSIKPTSGPGSTLHVDVWQIYIGGQKPESLPGSRNDKIALEYEK